MQAITKFFGTSPKSKKRDSAEISNDEPEPTAVSPAKKTRARRSAQREIKEPEENFEEESKEVLEDEANVEEESKEDAEEEFKEERPFSFAAMEEAIPSDWRQILREEFSKPYFKELKKKLVAEAKAGEQIFPPENLIFNALKTTPWDKCKVVILGQDPYHDDGQAQGLCFSVPRNIRRPPSLLNIYKELEQDIDGFVIPKHGNLEQWAQRGVLLLNAGLTVRAHKANSHKTFGWHQFTDAIINQINQRKKNVVFILWGADAHKKGKNIDSRKHLVLKSPHPSGLSANKKTAEYPHGFFQNHHFSKTNTYLTEHGLEPIDWTLD